jgi:NAD(P)-dependent dehydrogenase (short-subunit alcohol dehydrogenase family)
LNHFSVRELHLGEPSDIANAVLFLLSDESKHINGAEIVIDAGQSAQYE